MPLTLSTPAAADLPAIVATLASWQRDDVPVQLHPGDVGWNCRFGLAEAASALSVWSRDSLPLLIAQRDGADLLRFAVAPAAVRDEALARAVLADLDAPERGLLPAGPAAVEVRCGGALTDLLVRQGWARDEPWAPLVRDLSAPVEGTGLHVEVAGPAQAAERVAVQRAAFQGSTFTRERWEAMASGPAYAQARCLLGRDSRGIAVAAVTVWSAGPGRPGLLEPMGVHPEHRGHGHGRAICLAAAAALRDLGCSTAMVATPAGNTAAVATYAAAGFRRLPDVRDLRRQN